MPVFDDLAYDNSAKILTATMDCSTADSSKNFCIKMKIRYLPTICLFNGNRYLQYDGIHSVDGLLDFVNSAAQRWGESVEVLEINTTTGLWSMIEHSSDFI